MIFTCLSLIGGLIFLTLGANALVKGAVSTALRANISPLLIGLTIVGFGTSTPELLASMQAAWQGNDGIAVGNIVGSNIFNILAILGITALVRKTHFSHHAWGKSGMVMLAVTVLGCMAMYAMPTLPRWLGALALGLLGLYVYWEFIQNKNHPTSPAESDDLTREKPLAPLVAGGFIVGGLAGLMLGANLLVTGAVTLAQLWGVSDTIIGLTIVAAGTSLPELATSVVGAMRKQPEIAIGNIIGSNIFNLIGILGATTLVMPLSVSPQIAGFDIWIMLASTVALLVFARVGYRLTRSEGALLLAGYVLYATYLAQSAAVAQPITNTMNNMPFLG